MEIAWPSFGPNASGVQSGPTSQRRYQNEGEDAATVAPRRKRRGTTSAASPTPSTLQMEGAYAKDGSYASLVGKFLFMCSQVHVTDSD